MTWLVLRMEIEQPIVLLGGPGDALKGEQIVKQSGHNVYNGCGVFNINQSASLVQQANKVITHDTGLMHIAAAFKKDIISIWGNTIPEFGMSPYFPEGEGAGSCMIQVEGLKCRPCSKIGYDNCPKEHFKCMMEIDVDRIVSLAED